MGRKEEETKDLELMPSEQLPGVGFLEGVVRVFEGFGSNRQVTFAFREASNRLSCGFCGQDTNLRLVCVRKGEQAASVICHDCKDDIANAAKGA